MQRKDKAMTNDEYFNEKPMKEAIAKWRDDCANGFYGDIQEWLKSPFMDFSKGKVVRGRFYAYDWIEEKISKMDSLKVTGYLLEFKGNGDADYKPSEFATGMKSNYYADCFDGQPEQDEWYKGEVWVGYFADMPDVFLDDGTTWYERCGVDFDPRTTPTEDPKADGTWEGDCVGGAFLEPMKWRVRKVTVNGRLGDKARQYFRKFPNIYMKHEW